MTQIIKQDIGEKLADSFFNYAMYVIIDRALPNIKDGLKPVQRRVLYSMNNLKLSSSGSFKKSARVVGDCLGTLHPHGDSSVYLAMVNMAQTFSTNYPLVNGHGNFGSVDGDSPAAMRYTEAKLSPYGEQMLKDLNKNTVDFQPNFDESFQEPTVLPTLFPNLLANGSTGIAVSMATSIPPHNAEDLYKAIKLMINNELEDKTTDIEDLIAIVKAPDFPTGAEILDLKEIHKGYRTGRGRVTIRSKYTIEEVGNREQIVITEIPYKVNKAKLVENIDNLRKTSLDEIREVRDESDKDGIRVVVELKKDVNTDWIVKRLLKHTQMQDSFSMNMVALADGRPITFTLKDALDYFLAHVAETIIRRTQYDLSRAEKRKHLVDGILVCLERIDEVISTIKASKTNADIITNLQDQYELSEDQAKSISDMRLRALSQASADDYQEELDTLNGNIEKWNSIISDEKILLGTMQAEIEEVSEIYKGERKSEIVDEDLSESDDRELVKDEMLVITLTKNGLIKSISEDEYQVKGRGTKGSRASKIKDDDSIEFMLMPNSRDDLLFFTNTGRCHVIEAYKIPITSKTTAGRYVNNYIDLESDEKIVNMLSRSVDTTGDLIFATRNGVGKRLELSNLSTRRSSTKVIGFRDSDELIAVRLLDKEQEVIVFTAKGQGIRFNPDAEGGKGIRAMGRSAVGVNVIRLAKDDHVVSMALVDDEETLFLITEKGLGKRVEFKDFPTTSRGAKGVRAIGINDRSGDLLSTIPVSEKDDLFIATKDGLMSRTLISGIRVMGRSATGVKVINLNDGDLVASVSKNTDDAEDGDDE